MTSTLTNQAAADRSIGPDTTVAERFREVAARAPEHEALRTAARAYTYGEIDRWSDAIAARLIEQRLPTDVPVAIVTRDVVALVPAAFGVIKAGHFFVMIDATEAEDRASLILEQSTSSFCLVDSLDRIPEAVKRMRFDAIGTADDPAPAAPPVAPPNDHVLVIYTSGTTGTPKAILSRQRGFVRNMLRLRGTQTSSPNARASFLALPGFARTPNHIFHNLLYGSTLCAFDVRGASLSALARWIAEERITNLSIPPSLFRRMVASVPSELDFSSVTFLRLGADKITPEDVQTFRKFFPRTCGLHHGFASSETGGGVIGGMIDHDTPIPGPLVPMGTVRSGIELWLVDENRNPVPDGEVGEIVVRSTEVADGYWRDPELTATKFVFDPEHPELRTVYTGDLARRDPATGLYYFIGRSDARLKIHGRRIDPSEVEAALLATGDLQEAVVVGKPDAQGTMRLVAYVVMKPGRACVPRAIRATVRASAPAWMVPTRIFEIDSVPVTGPGKVDRKALAARVETDTFDDSSARDDLDRRMLALWSRVAGMPVQLDDDFFDDLGGESVVAAHLVTEIEKETGKSIPLSLLLELNTVAKLTDYLRTGEEADRIAVAIQREGSRPPLFVIAGAGGSVMRFRFLAAALGADQPVWGLQHHGFIRGRLPASFSAVAACYVDAVRGVQPEGPYHLAGYSVGGQMAFEMARQLERAGEEVAFLGLIDASASDMRTSFGTRLRARIEQLRERPLEKTLQYTREAFVRLFLRKGKKRRKGDFAEGADVPGWVAEKNADYLDTRRRFELRPYGGAVTLFRARHGMGTARTEPDLGWNRVGVGSLAIHEVDGDHLTCLTTRVESLGRAMKSALAQTRPEAQ